MGEFMKEDFWSFWFLIICSFFFFLAEVWPVIYRTILVAASERNNVWIPDASIFSWTIRFH